ncbi:metal ABC transporter substrate-binding protein [Micromonospora endophytica]|uniref:Zinc ABC transporter substrate-binding protein n=1 Tax=Micromonospora endophytica TaxID=515350 RepID=A0A2W2BYF3_9ACTN|nr:metal ABC transporter substrate-binding protein [Micromonospora endophytica]PZF84898.1 zinc ABC transporter substrate-binding protein [Micromonospora endophytica]RIW47351.1 zinc ABC transporter substrate-binding protein [Micromonospora endophytica]BCJ60828.1 zinc ABC transporter substrate-binding protein [Micromonospora endophytica]
MTFRSTSRSLAVTAATVLTLAGLTACSTDGGSGGSDPNRVDVVAGFYPLQFLAERIGGDAVTVTNLARPGAEPHDLELNPGQVGQISEAELVVFLHGFQPALDEAVEQNAGDRAFDVAGVEPLLDAAAGDHDHDHEGEGEGEHAEESSDGAKDPHVWLDPTRLATIGDKLAERLGTVDPDRAGDYTQRAATLRTELERLDSEFTEGLKSCQRREIVVSHTAFGYLAQKYQLAQIGITGLSPEDEPSPQRLGEVIEEAREHQATTIFFETLVSPKVAETIAREVGAQTAVLDPIEGLSAENGGDYLSVMRTNLETLRTALSCP